MSRAARVVEVVDELGLQLVFHLGDCLGGARVVEVVEHGGALLGVELLEDVRDVGGVKLVEAAMGDRELHLREVAVEQVHVVPCDDLLVDTLLERLRHRNRRFLDEGVQSAQDAARADLRAEKAQLGARLGELEVVDADDLHALRVDDLPVHEVACKQDLFGLQVAESNVDGVDGKRDAVFVELVDVFAPRDHERNLAGPWNARLVMRGKTSPVEMARSEMVPIFSPLASTTGFPII